MSESLANILVGLIIAISVGYCLWRWAPSRFKEAVGRRLGFKPAASSCSSFTSNADCGACGGCARGQESQQTRVDVLHRR